MRGEDFLKMCISRAPFSKMHPSLLSFFKNYFSHEKVIFFNNQYILNTHFPPYPGPAFDTLISNFNEVGEGNNERLFSVTIAVTNRCNYGCWHCYNAGRSQQDIQLPNMKEIISQIQNRGAANVTLSGGEPLLREDLEDIVSFFDERTSLTLNTTGKGLTPQRAQALRDAGLFACGISLDSMAPTEHDNMRGYVGAFQIALDALKMASDAGLYPYIISVATRKFLEPDRFRAFMHFAAEVGALEVHILEPSATGNLSGKTSVLLNKQERRSILEYQKEVAQDEKLPVLSTFTYLEGPDAFGCGAGLTHLYIDGSGEICPCNLVPTSFGNITQEPFDLILDRMGQFFRKPRPGCVGKILCPHIDSVSLPLMTDASTDLCLKYLPVKHKLPLFFATRNQATQEVGQDELRDTYNGIHRFYDEFWLCEAGKPVEELINLLYLAGNEKIFEAGCGTGYATVRIASKLRKAENLTAVDISDGMLTLAKERAAMQGIYGIRFSLGDAIKSLLNSTSLDLIFSSWVLGYIPLAQFFEASSSALKNGGALAFIVHKENSPYEPLEIFNSIILEQPSALSRRVAFDFPASCEKVRLALANAGLEATHLCEGEVVFSYKNAAEALEHLKKSGAGTAYYEAVDPDMRDFLEEQFLNKLTEKYKNETRYNIIHNYIMCIAQKK